VVNIVPVQPILELSIELKDEDGNTIKRLLMSSDLLLNNLKNLLAALLIPEATSAVNVSLTCSDGVARSFVIAIGTPLFSSASPYGVKIQIGSGITTPTRDDYWLETPVAEGVPEQTIQPEEIMWKVSITLTSAADISEAGLSLILLDSGNVARTVLLCRDTFTAISVPAGGVISITYRLLL